MIYNLVSGELKPGKMAEWSEIVSNEFMPFLPRLGFKPVASFHAYTGNMNQMYWLFAYDDLTSMKKILDGAGKDPEYRRIMAKILSLIVNQTFTLVEPNPWSPMK